MVTLSYTALISPEDSKASYIAIVEATGWAGELLGFVANGLIVHYFGINQTAYVTSAVSFLSVMITLVFVTNVNHNTRTVKWRDVLSFSHILDAFKTLSKKRSGYKRLLLNLTVVMYTLPTIVMNCYCGGSFLYFVKHRGFSLTNYSLFGGYLDALKCFAGPLLVYGIRKLINPNQFHFAMGCAAMQVIGFTIMSIDWIPNSLWIGAIFLLTECSFFALVHSVQAKLCSEEELTQFFAVDFIIQCVLNCVVYVGAKEVYSASLSFWPGLFLAVCAFIYVLTMVVTSVVAHYHDKDKTLESE